MVGQHLWLIAGWDPGHKQDGGDILSDLWRLDLNTWQWKQITPQACTIKTLLSASSGFYGIEAFTAFAADLCPGSCPALVSHE